MHPDGSVLLSNFIDFFLYTLQIFFFAGELIMLEKEVLRICGLERDKKN